MNKKTYLKPLTDVVKLQQSMTILSGSNYGVSTKLQEEEEVDEAW